MIGKGNELFVHENASSLFAGFLLQRERDQVAETALGQRVLVGKQAVITGQRQLPGAITGVANERDAKLSG